MSVPFVHLGDVHLGAWPGGGLTAKKAAIRRAEAFATCRSCLQYVHDNDIPLVLIAGDLFEYDSVPRNLVMEVRDLMGALTAAQICIAAGNHDWAAADSYYRTLAWPGNVHLFLNEWRCIHLPELDVKVHGMGFTAPELTGPLLREYNVSAAADDTSYLVIVLHGDVVGGAAGSRYLPINRTDLLGSGADYVALGHIHKPQVVCERAGKAVAAYCGALEPQDAGEEGQHGFYQGTLHKGGASLEFIPAAVRSYKNIPIDISDCATMDQVIEHVQSALRGVSTDDLVRVALGGAVDAQAEIDLARLEPLGAEYFHFRLDDQTTAAYNLDELAQGCSARAVFVRHMRALLDEVEGRDKDVAALALQVGLQALGGQEVKLP